MRNVPPRLRRLAHVWARFWRERNGNVAFTFALTLIPILAFIGAAVDYSRANSVRVQLQAALDSTALMVAKTAAAMTADQLKSITQSYFLAQFNNPAATNINFSADYSNSGGGSNVVVNGSADMTTRYPSAAQPPPNGARPGCGWRWCSTPRVRWPLTARWMR
jgi:Flp pilus assembly protein TadG